MHCLFEVILAIYIFQNYIGQNDIIDNNNIMNLVGYIIFQESQHSCIHNMFALPVHLFKSTYISNCNAVV